jgi:hypothetical protein
MLGLRHQVIRLMTNNLTDVIIPKLTSYRYSSHNPSFYIVDTRCLICIKSSNITRSDLILAYWLLFLDGHPRDLVIGHYS